MVLGIDIGGNQIRAGMVDEAGGDSRIAHHPDSGRPGHVLASRCKTPSSWLVESTELPAGVGVGCKGLIDPDTTRIECLRGPLHFLQGLRIADIVGLPLEVPVFADNDARVALSGEMVWGAARGPGERPHADPGQRCGRRRPGQRPSAARAHRHGRPPGSHHGGSVRRRLLLRQSRLSGDGVFRARDRGGCLGGRASRVRFGAHAALPRTAPTGQLPHRLSGGQRRRRSGRRDCLRRHLQTRRGAGRTAAHLRSRNRNPGRPVGRRRRATFCSRCRKKCGAAPAVCWAAKCRLWSRRWPTNPGSSAPQGW